MVEQQTDRMVMVAFAVIIFGVLIAFFRKGVSEIMNTMIDKIKGLIDGVHPDTSAETSTSHSS